MSAELAEKLDEIRGVLEEALEEVAEATAEVRRLDETQTYWLMLDGLDKYRDKPRHKAHDGIGDHVRDVWSKQAEALGPSSPQRRCCWTSGGRQTKRGAMRWTRRMARGRCRHDHDHGP